MGTGGGVDGCPLGSHLGLASSWPLRRGRALEPVHGLEHLCLLGTGVGFWWVVLATTSRAPGVGMAAVFVVAMQGIALGGLMTLASRPWYAGYRLDDQQIAGVLMWCPAGFVYTAFAAAMLYRWLADREPAATLVDQF
jgi:putative membrane protein